MIQPINYSNKVLSGSYNKKNNQEKIETKIYQTDISKTKLVGIPKSYISFGSKIISDDDLEKLSKEVFRREQIAQYYDYLSRINVNINAEIEANNEIERLKEEGSGKYLGFIPHKGRVKKSKQLEIKESWRRKVKEAEKQDEIIRKNEDIYKALLQTDELEVFAKVKELLANKANSIDCKIAGYDNEKKEIRRILVEPIQRENALGTSEKIPPALLIYGPIRCGKSQLARAVAEEAGCNCRVLENISPKIFIDEITEAINEAKENYKKVSKENNLVRADIESDSVTGKKYSEMNVDEKANLIVNQKSPRTIIIIDDADVYFDPDYPGNSVEDVENNKTILKGLLDHSSEKFQDDEMSDAAGVTFIFTSNYPSKIDTEISLRKGKCDKLAVSIPSIEDSKKIIRFYLNKENEKIKKLQHNGKDIELIDINKLPIDRYDKRIEPDKQTGALYGAGIKAAVADSVSRYIESQDESVGINLPKLLASAKYRLSNEKLEIFKTEMENMGDIQHEIDGEEEFNLLIQAKNLDMLTEEQLKRYFSLNELFNN